MSLIANKEIPLQERFNGDLTRFALLDVDTNLGINVLDTYGVKMGCKDLKVSLRVTKRPDLCFMGEA